jgi:hypothetical protein
MLKSFVPGRRYLVVVPTLDEVERVINDASVLFVEPSDQGEHKTKSADLESLLRQGLNIVTTHKLYMDVAVFARQGLLEGYDIIVDEVLDVCAQVDGVSPKSFQEFYVGRGYAEVEPDGRVRSTPKWDAEVDAVSDTLHVKLYRLANAGVLYYLDNTFFIWALPKELLTAGRSFTVCTYMAEGSMFLRYLEKLGIPYVHEFDAEADRQFREQARRLIQVEDIPKLSNEKLSFSAQKHNAGLAKKVSSALHGLHRGPLKRVSRENLLITCSKQKWFHKGEDDPAERRAGPFASGSKMFKGATWIPNTTRGTNKYANATHAIYLYDQNMNPYIARYLGVSGDRDAHDWYAVAELIQWVYRTRVRRGEPVVLYLPSKRMRGLFQRWLDGEFSAKAGEALPLAA